MKPIYEPKGRAREYSPLALNVYAGCDHNCKYCYIKTMRMIHWKTTAVPRNNLLPEIIKQIPKVDKRKQILLCFMGDLYCEANLKYKMSSKVLKILSENEMKVAILSKGGYRILEDLEIFKTFKNIKIGASLTFIDEVKSHKYEPGAASPGDRFQTLKILKGNNIKTWASLEPVINPKESLLIIEKTHEYIDAYKVGTLNHFGNKINWKSFGLSVIKLLQKYNKEFYIKKNLQRYLPPNVTEKKHFDMDYLAGLEK